MLPVRGPWPGQWWCVSWITTPLLQIPHPGFGYTTGVGGADIISVNKPCQIKGPLTFLAYHNLLPFFDMRVRSLCKFATQIKMIKQLLCFLNSLIIVQLFSVLLI